MHSLSLSCLFLCSPYLCLPSPFSFPLWLLSICISILHSITFPHPPHVAAALQLPLFPASSSTYYALFSQSVKAPWPPNVLRLLSAFLSLSLSFSLCLSLLYTHARSHTHLSIEIEIMIMYPSVCIKVLPLQKNPGRHEMQT